MTARTGMSVLITTLRGMTNAGSADYTIAGSAYWTDDQLQTVLDHHRQDVYDAPTFPIAQNVSGTGIYKIYDTGLEYLEQGTAAFYLKDSAGSTVGTAGYTMDYERGIATFTADQKGSAYYATAASYNVNAAAADVWKRKAAQVANMVSFTADGVHVSKSDMIKNCLEMAKYYSGQAGVMTATMTRGDQW